MKKLLIATAALAMVAGTAQAQSSVTAYGRLDAGYKDYTTTTAAGVKTQTNALGYSAFTSSRFGVMGSEDLGGGLKAGFVVEGNIADAVGTTGSNNATAFNFGRQQYLTLSGNSFGTLLVGKTDSLVKQVFDSYDAGFSNNLTGAYDGFGTSATEITGSNVIGNRRDQVARLTLPKFGNFEATVGMLKSDVDTTSAAGVKTTVEDESGYELGAKYAAGNLSLQAAYRNTDSKSPEVAGTAGNCIAAGGTITQITAAADCASGLTRLSGAKTVAAADNTTESTAVGASYNFGPVVGFVQYFDQEVKANLAGTKVKEDAYTVGARVPFGKATLFASYTDGEKTSATNVKTDFEGMQVGVKYDLSKRTYGYVAYGESELQQVGSAKAKAENLAVGIAHHF
jgi:GBP family porin